MIKEIRDKKAQRYGLKALCKRQKAEGRRQKVLVIVLLLLCSFAVQAQNKLPQGKWEVTQITIEKNTNGKIDTAVYNAAKEIISHIPCMQELEIKGENIVLRYSDGQEETADYTLQGDHLTIHIATGNQIYKYKNNGSTITLTAFYEYVNNDLVAKKYETISEKRIITLSIK